MRLDKAVAGMDFAGLHQSPPPLHPLCVAPDKTHVVGKGAVDHLVVGVAQDAAHGGDETGVGGVGHAPLPAVFGSCTQRRHPPLALVGRVAFGHRPDGLHRNVAAIHQRQVLGWRDVFFARSDRFCHGLGHHDLHPRLQGRVARTEHGPAERGDVAWRCHRVEVAETAGQNRAIVAPAQGEGDRVGVLDLKDRIALLEVLEPVRRAVLFGVVRVQFLDQHVLIVDVSRRHTPAQSIRTAGQHHRDARNGAPDHSAALQFEAGEIPDGGGREPHMRIIGQQRAARGRAGSRRRPGVGGPGKSARLEGGQRMGVFWRDGRKGRQGPRHKSRIFGQAGNAGSGHVRQDVSQPRRVVQRQRHAGAQHLFAHLVRQLQAHQLDDGKAVGGSPRGNRGLEQKEFRRAAPKRLCVDLVKAGIDPGGIGLEGGQRFGVLRLDRLDGQTVDVEAAHKTVRFDGGRTEQFAQASLCRAAQHHHLPEPILRMGKAKPVKHVGVCGAKDMRNVGVVAHDLDRGADAGYAHHRIVIGQGPCGEVVDKGNGKNGQHDQHSRQANKPLKHHCHVFTSCSDVDPWPMTVR